MTTAARRRIRIGIDTGGTFTDVVAVDEHTGELAATKTPSTPADPAVGFMTGVHKVLDQLGLDGDSVSAVSHGTTVATNKLLEGKVENLGFITTEGYEFMLEIARQSVPDGARATVGDRPSQPSGQAHDAAAAARAAGCRSTRGGCPRRLRPAARVISSAC